MSKEDIMEATAEAFREHGYADLSIQKIADELGSGKSLIYYHFDDKEDLMESFLDFLKSEIERENEDTESFEAFLSMALGSKSEMWEFRKALYELRGRAPYNEKFAEKFRELDNLLLEKIEDLVQDKVEDPERSAELILSIIDGFVARKISAHSFEEIDFDSIKNKIKEIVEKDL